jgi:hypothetical protein
MVEYEQGSGCRMEFLQRTLDDDTAVPCGRCDNCAGSGTRPRSARRRAPRLRRRSTASGCRSSPGRRVADGRRPARCRGEGTHRCGGAGGEGVLSHVSPTSAGAVRCASSSRQAPRRAGSRSAARRVCAGARRLGLGRAPGRGRLGAVAYPSAARRIPRAEPRRDRSAAVPGRTRLGRRRARERSGGTAPSASRASGTASRLALSPFLRPGAARGRSGRQPVDAHGRRTVPPPCRSDRRCSRSCSRCGVNAVPTVCSLACPPGWGAPVRSGARHTGIP